MHIGAGNAELCSYQKVKLSETQCSSNVLSLSTDRNSCVMVVNHQLAGMGLAA